MQLHDAQLFELNKMIKGSVLPLICVIAVIAGFGAGFHFDFGGIGNTYDPGLFPVQAVNWMEDNPQPGNMFNEFTWGGYLLYREWPRQRVFIDGQTDFYGEELTRQYLTVIKQSSGWENVLANYRVDWAILPAAQPAAKELRSKPGWTVLYEDGTAVIIRKQP